VLTHLIRELLHRPRLGSSEPLERLLDLLVVRPLGLGLSLAAAGRTTALFGRTAAGSAPSLPLPAPARGGIVVIVRRVIAFVRDLGIALVRAVLVLLGDRLGVRAGVVVARLGLDDLVGLVDLASRG
jgi:hypothetical protein